MNEKQILDLWDTTRQLKTDHPMQQRKSRQWKRRLALIPLASGVASIALGIGLVGTAYADEINLDPILQVKPEVVNQQPQGSIPAVDRTVPKQDSENVLPSPKEPKIDLDFGQDNNSQDAKPKHRHHQDHQDYQSGQQSPEPNVKIDPQPDSQDQSDSSQPVQPQKQPLPTVTPAPPEPNTNLSPAQTDSKSVQQQPNLPKMDKDEKTNSPQKVVNSEPEPVVVGTDSEPHASITTGSNQTKDTNTVQLAASGNQVVEPVQKTKNGVNLPKTATPYGNLFFAGLSFLLGGWLLQLSRKMRRYA